MHSLGIESMDVAIVAIASNMEASIMATIFAKEAGIPYVVAKANSDMHEKVLGKVGADKIVFPEREMGERIAKNLISGNFIDMVELSDDFSMAEMAPLPDWTGKSLKELNIRQNYGINVIAKKIGDKVDININPDVPIEKDAILIIIGDNKRLGKIGKKNDNRK